MSRLGAARLVFGTPFIDSRPFLPPNPEVGSQFAALPSGGTITFDRLSSMRKAEPMYHGTYLNRYYVHLPILNQQKSRISSSTAKKVYAKLVFEDLNRKPICSGGVFDGRWEGSAQPSVGESHERLRLIDILPGDTQTLDIATRSVRGGFWYVSNNDSYPDPEYAANRLGQDGFVVQVRLNGANVFEKSVAYRLTSVGRNEKPEITRL